MLKKHKIDGVYIIHVKKGHEMHQQRIADIFGQMKIEYELVSDGDISNFSNELLEKYFCPNVQELLKKAGISCTLNHLKTYERIIQNKNRYALVFEDDPFFLGDFVKQIIDIIREAQHLEPGFIVSLENSTLKFPSLYKTKKNQLLYEAEYGRCAGAYLIDLKAAEIIINDLKSNKCNQIIDWLHNSLIKKKIIKMYWAHPPLVEQGSHNGLMKSSLSNRNANFVKRFRWLIKKYYRMTLYRLF